MFLRHIQLIFSSVVKTWRIEKCFIARNNFSLTNWPPGSIIPGTGTTLCYRKLYEYSVKLGNSRVVLRSAAVKFSVPAVAFFLL